MSTEWNTTYTAASWTALVVIVGGVWYSSQKRGKKAAPPNPVKGAARSIGTGPKKENNAKKQRREAFLSEAQNAPAVEKQQPVENTWLSNDNSDDVDNREFAKRFSSVKEGTKFTKKTPETDKKRQKSVKISQAAKVSDFEADDKPSAPSSTAGIDADDDQSPAVSPQVTAADASGVSDMLEAAPAGPSVLRLTGTDKEKPKPKHTKAPEHVETKKQRQNRKKAEAAKEAREEAEKERKVLMEKQRRTARIAEGRAAKDGSQFTASANGGKPSAWTAGAPNGASSATESKNGGGYLAVQPLDTFESSSSKGSGVAVAAAAQPKAPSDSWMSSLPSEEEQMERLKEDTDEWSTVKTKAVKKVKKVKKDSPPSSVQGTATQSRPPVQAVQKPASNGKAAKPANSYGSFSALTTEGDDEGAEKEWDV